MEYLRRPKQVGIWLKTCPQNKKTVTVAREKTLCSNNPDKNQITNLGEEGGLVEGGT